MYVHVRKPYTMLKILKIMIAMRYRYDGRLFKHLFFYYSDSILYACPHTMHHARFCVAKFLVRSLDSRIVGGGEDMDGHDYYVTTMRQE